MTAELDHGGVTRQYDAKGGNMPGPAKKYWLMKSEPGSYSIEDLERDGRTCWEGVRNYQARNLMRDEMAAGDLVLFYHSSTDPAGVAGIARIEQAAYPDHFAFDRRSEYYDPKSSPESPAWMMVDVGFVERFCGVVTLADLKANPQLADMMVTKRGARLSVQPVTKAEFEAVRKMGRKLGS
jgi:predicted RNA-binding protein with PUA-like domain